MKIKARFLLWGAVVLVGCIWRIASAACPDASSACQSKNGQNVCCYRESRCQQAECMINCICPPGATGPCVQFCPYREDRYQCYQPPGCTFYQWESTVTCPGQTMCPCGPCGPLV